MSRTNRRKNIKRKISLLKKFSISIKEFEDGIKPLNIINKEYDELIAV